MPEVISGQRLFTGIQDANVKLDQLGGAVKELRKKVDESLPVSFPAFPEDRSIPEVIKLHGKVDQLAGKVDSLASQLGAVMEKLNQFFVVS